MGLDEQKTANKILEVIDKNSSFLLSFHVGPDADSVASCLAFGEVLKNFGKKVTIIWGDSNPVGSFNDLPGIKAVKKANLTQVNINDYDILIILDTSSLYHYSKIFSWTNALSLTKIIIDHHQTNNIESPYRIVFPKYPATSQILYDLFKLWKADITPNIAANLYTGINSDTLGFKTNNVVHSSLEVAADLFKINSKCWTYAASVEHHRVPEELTYLQLFLQNIKLHFDGHVAISSISYLELKKHHIQPSHTLNSNAVDLLVSVNNWDIGAVLKETKPNEVWASFRTRDSQKYNLAILAQSLGGGGHPAASGATIYSSLSEAQEKLLTTIKLTYPNI